MIIQIIRTAYNAYRYAKDILFSIITLQPWMALAHAVFLAANPQQFEGVLAAVYQMNQRLRPVNAFDELRPGRPGRNAQYRRQIHPVLQSGNG